MHTILIALVLSLAPSAGPRIIEDDFEKALKLAQKEKKILFVDAWAPWCHTCIFMREHVLNKPEFKRFEKDIVFASIDTEKTKSAAFLEKFPIDVWPTLLFIDPEAAHVKLKWLGSADEKQMEALLTSAKSENPSPGDEFFARGENGMAAQKYVSDKSSRGTISMLTALYMAHNYSACAKASIDGLSTPMSHQEKVAVITWGLGCALDVETKEKEAFVKQLSGEAKAALTLDGVLADDMSGIYDVLVSERHAAKDDAGAVAMALEWLTFLEKEAAKAKSPKERAVFDPHRVSASIEAKVPVRAIAALEQSEKEIPKDYNAPARLALLHKETGDYKLALTDISRALTKCKEGPRKVRLFEIKAAVFEKLGDVKNQKQTLEEALAFAKALPKAQMSEKKVGSLVAQIEKLNTN
jgi:thiol-disulfide isomerase/thioredoxin